MAPDQRSNARPVAAERPPSSAGSSASLHETFVIGLSPLTPAALPALQRARLLQWAGRMPAVSGAGVELRLAPGSDQADAIWRLTDAEARAAGPEESERLDAVCAGGGARAVFWELRSQRTDFASRTVWLEYDAASGPPAVFLEAPDALQGAAALREFYARLPAPLDRFSSLERTARLADLHSIAPLRYAGVMVSRPAQPLRLIFGKTNADGVGRLLAARAPGGRAAFVSALPELVGDARFQFCAAFDPCAGDGSDWGLEVYGGAGELLGLARELSERSAGVLACSRKLATLADWDSGEAWLEHGRHAYLARRLNHLKLGLSGARILQIKAYLYLARGNLSEGAAALRDA